MIVVSDTSVITNLININHLRLLEYLYQSIVVPQSVYEELSVLGEPVTKQLEEPWISIQSIVDTAEIEAFQTKTRLDRGESEAILLTQKLQADLLLIDEQRGRTEAQRLGIRITGLLGILVEAKRKNAISSVKPLMDQLISNSAFRVSPKLYDIILTMAQEKT